MTRLLGQLVQARARTGLSFDYLQIPAVRHFARPQEIITFLLAESTLRQLAGAKRNVMGYNHASRFSQEWKIELMPQAAGTAVVTGAGQGIGRAMARLFATNGMHTVLVGRTRAKLEAAAAEVETLGPAPAIFVADVAVENDVARLAAALAPDIQALDVLVNCAGEAFIAPLEETTRDDWDRLIANNLTGPFLMTRALLPLLRRSHNASIINIASKVALKGYGTVTAYTAAKAGLVGFTQSLADELRDDEIRVVALCPGPVDTPMRWDATPDFDRKMVIDAEAVARTVLHMVQLPRGVTLGTILIESVHYD